MNERNLDIAPSGSKLPILLYAFALLSSMLVCSQSVKPNTEGILPLFGTYRILAIHGIASIPFAWSLATLRRNSFFHSHIGPFVALVSSIVIALVLGTLSQWLFQWEAGAFVRFLIRNSLALTIVFTWIALSPFAFELGFRKSWVGSILIWIAVPGIYGWKQSELCREQFGPALLSMRLERALNHAAVLSELGSNEWMQNESPSHWRRKLGRQKKSLEAAILEPLREDASLDSQLQRVIQLFSLSRFDEGASLLQALSLQDGTVLHLRALAARELREWELAELLCRKLVERKEFANPEIFQILSESLVNQGKLHEAILWNEKGADQFQESASEFELRLGGLWGELGNHRQAERHWLRAKELNPATTKEVEKRIRSLQMNGCRLLGS